MADNMNVTVRDPLAPRRQMPPIVIGRAGEYGATTVTFDLRGLIDRYGAGMPTLLHKRPPDDEAYIVPLSAADTETHDRTEMPDSETLVWHVGQVATSYVGNGKIELQWHPEGAAKKSAQFDVVVLGTIGNPVSEIPDAQQIYLDVMQGIADDAEDAAAKAEAAVSHYPQIRDGYWWVWDAEGGEWKNTEVKAAGLPGDTGKSAYQIAVDNGYVGTVVQWLASLKGGPGDPGTPGVSPTVAVASIEGGNRVTITDAAHPTGQTFDVMDGVDGRSPAITVTAITGGHRVTITDETHPFGQSLDVMDGDPGDDYVLTPQDKAEIAGMVPVPTVPTEDISANTAARHTHENKAVLDGITSAKVQSWDGKGTYSKPSGGIPASDLAPGVIPSVPQMATQADMSDWTSGKTVDAATLKTDFNLALLDLDDLHVNKADKTELPDASTSTPVMDGTAAVGTSTDYARADHIHPSDTTRLSTTGNAYRTASIPMGHLDATSTATVMTATVDGITELRDGVCMWLLNGVVTSASGFTLNVNGLGAKPCYSSLAAASRSTTIFNVNYALLMIYNSTRVDGGCWDIVYGVDTNTTYTPPKLGFGYGTCTTAAATAAKTASISSYALTTGGIVSIKFDNDVPANATLNISSKGAKAIYHRGAAITAGVIKAGDTATFVYSTYYHLISIDRDESGDDLPSVTASDNGKFLRVVSGAWAAASLPSAEGASF